MDEEIGADEVDEISKSNNWCGTGTGARQRKVISSALVNLAVWASIGMLIFLGAIEKDSHTVRATEVTTACSILSYVVKNTTCDTTCKGLYRPVAAGKITGTYDEKEHKYSYNKPFDLATLKPTSGTPVCNEPDEISPVELSPSCPKLTWGCYRVVLNVQVHSYGVHNTSFVKMVVLPDTSEKDIEDFGSCVNCRCSYVELLKPFDNYLYPDRPGYKSSFKCFYHESDPSGSLEFTAVSTTKIYHIHAWLFITISCVMCLGSSLSLYLCYSARDVAPRSEDTRSSRSPTSKWTSGESQWEMLQSTSVAQYSTVQPYSVDSESEGELEMDRLEMDNDRQAAEQQRASASGGTRSQRESLTLSPGTYKTRSGRSTPTKQWMYI